MKYEFNYGLRTKKQDSVSLSKKVHANQAVQAVIEESADVVQAVLENMLDEGEITMTGVYFDSYSHDMAEGDSEDEFDGDLELNDEDEYVEEREPRVEFDDFSSPFVGNTFDIVVFRQNGRMKVEPPENVWSGAVGVTTNAQSALLAFSNRIKAYEIISERLERLFKENRFSPGESLLKDVVGALGQQKAFANKHGLDGGSLSRYLKNARLVFEDHSVPLKELFS